MNNNLYEFGEGIIFSLVKGKKSYNIIKYLKNYRSNK